MAQGNTEQLTINLAHTCELPDPDLYPVGTRAVCACRKYYFVVEKRFGRKRYWFNPYRSR